MFLIPEFFVKNFTNLEKIEYIYRIIDYKNKIPPVYVCFDVKTNYQKSKKQ